MLLRTQRPDALLAEVARYLHGFADRQLGVDDTLRDTGHCRDRSSHLDDGSLDGKLRFVPHPANGGEGLANQRPLESGGVQPDLLLKLLRLRPEVRGLLDGVDEAPELRLRHPPVGKFPQILTRARLDAELLVLL